MSPYVGEVMPEPSKAAQAIANAHGATIQVQGAEAARLLGLQHVALRKFALAGKPSGLALSALWYPDKEQVTPGTIKTIREKLTPEAFQEFRAETSAMPAWTADTLHRVERDSARA